MSAKRDLKDLIAICVRAGWTCERSGGGHWRLRSPSGALVFCPSTPSDARGLLNLRAKLRQKGAPL